MSSPLSHIQNWPELVKQANWSASALAKNCGISERTLRRFFLRQMGRNPKEWLAEQRQRKGVELLGKGATVKEVSGELGYTHPNNFSRYHKRKTGICPSQQTSLNSPSKQQLSENDR